MKKELYQYNQDYINRWIISYADFTTILLALFMVMYAFSMANNKDLPSVLKTIASNMYNQKTHQPENNFETRKKLLKVFGTTQIEVKYSDIDSVKLEKDYLALDKMLKKAQSNAKKDAAAMIDTQKMLKASLKGIQGINIINEPRGTVIRLDNSIIFSAGSDIINNSSIQILDKISQTLKSTDNPIRIEGHSDNTPIHNSKYPSNWELSTARATNVLKYLVYKYKFDPRKMSAAGYGEFYPIANNNTAEGRNSNRRVDIVILNSSEKLFEPTAR